MAERFEIVQKALVKMLEDKKYATLRDILDHESQRYCRNF